MTSSVWPYSQVESDMHPRQQAFPFGLGANITHWFWPRSIPTLWECTSVRSGPIQKIHRQSRP